MKKLFLIGLLIVSQSVSAAGSTTNCYTTYNGETYCNTIEYPDYDNTNNNLGNN